MLPSIKSPINANKTPLKVERNDDINLNFVPYIPHVNLQILNNINFDGVSK